jgi:chromosome segregation ATPase
MQVEIGGLKCQVEESRKLSRKLSGELRMLNTENTELKRETRSARLQIKQLSNLVEDFNREYEEKESAIKAEARVEEDIQIIKAMLTGVSSRQAVALQLNSKKGHILFRCVIVLIGCKRLSTLRFWLDVQIFVS